MWILIHEHVKFTWTEFLQISPRFLTFLHAGMARKAEEEAEAYKKAGRGRRR